MAYINHTLDTKIEDNMKIIIKTPKLYILTIGNHVEEVKSIYTKVEGILKDLDVKLGDLDYTNPKLEDEVTYGSEITVTRVKEEVEEIKEVIPYDTVVKKSNQLDKGNTKIAQEGKDGLKIKRIKNTFENNELVRSDLIEEEIVEKAVPKIIEKVQEL